MYVPAQSVFEGAEAGSDASKSVPEPLAHCMVAVKKRGKDAKDAWNICRASQHKTKNLKGGYSRDEKLKASTTQTQKGRRADEKHRREPDAHEKREKFSRLFRKIEPGVVRR